MKKRMIACAYVFILLLSCKLAFSYFYNEHVIDQYHDGNYSLTANPLLFCNWFQPYVAHYNIGNIHYQNGQYEDAIDEYKKALTLHPSKKKECSVRINLALAMIKNLGEEYASEENVETSIATLKEARSVLLEDSCATETGDGHSETAETLKREIDAMIEELENEQDLKEDANNDSKEKSDEEKEEDTYEKNIEEKLQQQQSEAYQERVKALENYDSFDYEYNFDANGRVW